MRKRTRSYKKRRLIYDAPIIVHRDANFISSAATGKCIYSPQDVETECMYSDTHLNNQIHALIVENTTEHQATDTSEALVRLGCKMKDTIANSGIHPIFVTMYHFIGDKDYVSTHGGLVSDYWADTTLDHYYNNISNTTIGASSTRLTSPELDPRLNLWQNAAFRRVFKIKSSKTIKLEPGQQYTVHLRSKTKFYRPSVQLAFEGTLFNVLKGFNEGVIYRTSGCLGTESTDTTMSLTAATLQIWRQYTYKIYPVAAVTMPIHLWDDATLDTTISVERGTDETIKASDSQ